MNRGDPAGAAVLAFWTLTRRSRHLRQGGGVEVYAVDAEAVEFLERGELSGDAFDEVREAFRLGVVVGDREDVDLDRHGRLGGKLRSSKVPRIDWEPTTITSGCWMIWQAVRIACSSWSRLISLPRPRFGRCSCGSSPPMGRPRASRSSRGPGRSGHGAARRDRQITRSCPAADCARAAGRGPGRSSRSRLRSIVGLHWRSCRGSAGLRRVGAGATSAVRSG